MNQQVADPTDSFHVRHRSPPRLHAPVEHPALRILVVENEERSAKALVQGLIRRGYRADSVTTAGQALRVHRQADPTRPCSTSTSPTSTVWRSAAASAR
ncbi:hypothetical protein ACQ4WX_00660 [Streptomyces lasalocidi]